jgi:hypothetical protein
MICILHPVTEGAFAIRITMPPLDLIIRGESVPGHLPNQDADFERVGTLPYILSMSYCGSLDHSLI